MSNNLQAADFLRKAADALIQGGTTESTCRTVTPTTTSTSITSDLRSLFGSYSTNSRGQSSIQRRFSGALSTSTIYWTHRFFALANSSQENVPAKEERYVLQKAGLGEKKLTFKKNNDAEYFTDKICEVFPKLKDIGGFEILRTEPGRRQMLDKLKVPPGGYTTAFLADESALGQAVCYLRPIQVDLDVEPDDVEVDSCGPEEKCLNCLCMVGVNQLREHISMCKKETKQELEDIKLEKPNKRSRPICDFACELESFICH